MLIIGLGFFPQPLLNGHQPGGRRRREPRRQVGDPPPKTPTHRPRRADGRSATNDRRTARPSWPSARAAADPRAPTSSTRLLVAAVHHRGRRRCSVCIVEAFWPRRARFVAQAVLAVRRHRRRARPTPCGSTPTSTRSTSRRCRRAARSAPRARSSVDGPGVFTWGILLVFAAAEHAAVRRAPARGRAERLHRTRRRRPGLAPPRPRPSSAASSTPRSSRWRCSRSSA